MEKYAMLEIFNKNINIETYCQEKQEEINNYIDGKIDNIKLEKKTNTPKEYMQIFNIIYDEFFTKNSETAKKMLNILVQLYPERTRAGFQYYTQRYKVYYNSNIDIGFVLSDIIKFLARDFSYYNDYFFSKLKKWFNNFQESENIEWEHMFKYYGDEIEKFVVNTKKLDFAKSMIAFLSFFRCKNNTEKKSLYLNIIENYIYANVKEIFEKKEMNKIYSQYFKNTKSQDFYNKCTKLSDYYDKRYYNKNLIIMMCLNLYKESDLIDDILKVFIIKADFKNYIKDFRLNNFEEAVSFFRKYNLSYLFDVKLYSGIILSGNFMQDNNFYIEKIENILNNNDDVLEEYINKQNKDEKIESSQLDLDYVLVTAILIKNNIKSAENNIHICDNIILKYSKIIEEGFIKYRHGFFIKYNQKNINISELVKEKDIDINNVDMNDVYIKFPYYLNMINNEMIYTVISSSFLYSHSYVARNIINILFMKYNFTAEGTTKNTISMFIDTCESLKKYENENKFDILAKYTNIKYVIKSYILYGKQETKYINYFKQFIKSHKDDAVYMLLNDIKNDPKVTSYIDILRVFINL